MIRAIFGYMEEEEVRRELLAMEKDASLITESAYRANIAIWPDHRIPFIENHVEYLKNHPTLNPKYYLANLRLMLKRR